MADLGKNAYVKQLLIFLSNQDYQSSLGFGKEFVEKFPAEMISHYLLAKVLYFNKDFAGSAMEGRKSFNLASDPDDILACAITTSTAYYELKEYAKGYELLNSVQKSTEDLETLRFVFALALSDENAALKHVQKLYALNKKSAEALMLKMIG